MKIKTAEFKISAPDLRDCPPWAVPEFALIGRSNVGKSSLINLLTERSGLAKVSETPGKTQLINFFLINGAWGLVDLPGYGYAKVGKERRFEFNEAVANFIERRETLRRVFVLIDSRLEPQAIDLEFLRWLETCAVPYTLVFTKADKQSPTRTRAAVESFNQAVLGWRREPPDGIVSSAKTRAGRGEILRVVEAALAEA